MRSLRPSYVLWITLWLQILGPASWTFGQETDDSQLQEYSQRQIICKSANIEDQWELAQCAIENEHTEEAISICRQILQQDITHAEAYSALITLTSDTALKSDSRAFREARRILPQNFIELESRRFIVLSDANMVWTRQQSERLERAYHQFQRFARRLDLRPLPLRHKLVCVLFAQREDYLEFSGKFDNVTDPWIAGYYSPHHDRTVFYDVRSRPSVTDARSQLSEMNEEIEQLSRDLRQAERSGQQQRAEHIRQNLARYQKHVASESQRVDEFENNTIIATTIHETVHQLMFHTGVQNRQVQYPLWICEGLATSFETDKPQEAFGPSRDYAPRREIFQEYLLQDDMLDLNQLVTITKLHGCSERTVRKIYHQSYALVSWMNRFRKEELRTFIMMMRALPPGKVSRDRHLEIFEDAFGSTEKLQKSWLRYEASLMPGSSAGNIIRQRYTLIDSAPHDVPLIGVTSTPAGLIGLLMQSANSD